MLCSIFKLYPRKISEKPSINYGKIPPAKPADVAQLAEHITRNNEVMGSIPIIGLQKKLP